MQLQLLRTFSLSLFSPDLTFSIYIFLIFIYLHHNNNKALPRFKYCNSRSPLPFPIDLSPITHVRALPD
ncbi:hypothetical protein HanIR_Chr14g0712341 [Helianthus annuus]|nr:hypothetical protein HanIR_Chr14g0712341 [Helianthus annuus]